MTAQYTDRIRYKRRVYELFSEPLEDFFNDEYPKPKIFSPACSACWRGYLARWSIKRDRLYLEQIEPWPGLIPEIDETGEEAYRRYLDEIFPGSTGPIFAEWYSGELSLISGKLLQYIHLPYASVYANEIVLEIENGKIVGVASVIHRTEEDDAAPSILERRDSSRAPSGGGVFLQNDQGITDP